MTWPTSLWLCAIVTMAHMYGLTDVYLCILNKMSFVSMSMFIVSLHTERHLRKRRTSQCITDTARMSERHCIQPYYCALVLVLCHACFVSTVGPICQDHTMLHHMAVDKEDRRNVRGSRTCENRMSFVSMCLFAQNTP